MAKKPVKRKRDRTKGAGMAQRGVCLKGPDGRIYFIPEDSLKAFALPDPMQVDSGSEISAITGPALQEALNNNTVISVENFQVDTLIKLLGR